MKPARAAVRTCALALFAVVALIPVSTVSVYADANPANHGHHYGQLKHRPAPPPPVNPPPVVTPAPTSPPGATHSGGVGAGISHVSTQAQLPAVQIKIQLPLAGVPGGEDLVRSVPQPQPPPGFDPWLILALVLSVSALWLYAFIRLARSAGRWRMNQPAR